MLFLSEALMPKGAAFEGLSAYVDGLSGRRQTRGIDKDAGINQKTNFSGS